ncbi:MAG: DUF2220 family protein [Anaerolineae bacterium]|jgi:hypothetical protein|nr:DUF2220 family protein [Anaerolineae bacterium]
MITPDEIKRKSEREYTRYLTTWLTGDPFTPIALPIGRIPSEYSELSRVIGALDQGDKSKRGYGYEITWQKRNTQRYGPQSIPQTITIPTEHDLLKLAGKVKEFGQFKHDVGLIRAAFGDRLADWMLKNIPLILKYADDWPDLIKVGRYFDQHPRPDLYLRQLPIAVHTKFIETHEEAVRALLDGLLPPDAIRDPTSASVTRRYYLRYAESLIRLRILDPILQAALALPFSELSVPISQFAGFEWGQARYVIVENQMTFLALPPLPNTIAIFGKGFDVGQLKQATQLRACVIVYWGDLDAHGFQILSQLRGFLPQTVSVMMDRITWQRFEPYAVDGTPTKISLLPNLTPDESDLFVELQTHNRRLEQEHLDHAYVIACLSAL